MQRESLYQKNNRDPDIQNGLKVSVVVPVFNEDKLIGRLLKSLEDQTVRPCEVLVIDAGSTDRTVEIAETYQAKVHINVGQGEYPARNFGSKLACGDIIIQTSADTIFEAETLQNVISEFEKDPRLGALAGPGLPYDGPLWSKVEYRLYYHMLDLWCKIDKAKLATTNFLAFRTDCFMKTQGFSNEPGGDSLFFIELSRLTKTKFSYVLSVKISGRRVTKSGFWRFHLHFIYVMFLFSPTVYGFLRKNPTFRALVNFGWIEHNKRIGI